LFVVAAAAAAAVCELPFKISADFVFDCVVVVGKDEGGWGRERERGATKSETRTGTTAVGNNQQPLHTKNNQIIMTVTK
jgi:hypothetical protein